MESLLHRMMPLSLDEFIGQRHLVGEGCFLRKMIDSQNIRSCLFYGPSGSGKTALSHIISKRINAEVFSFNAALSSITDIKKIMDKTQSLFSDKKLVVIIDEIHHFNTNQQDVFLPFIEDKDITVIGITTRNPFFYINRALMSRFIICEFKPLNDDEMDILIDRVISKGFEGRIKITESARRFFIKFAGGDARKLINFIDAASIVAKNEVIDDTVIKELSLNRYLEYDKRQDYHYDIVSAFIKSMRGSDPDATVYWLARMIEAGEDPLFIARRIVIAASEDVGLANPMALVIAQMAYESVERVGMPEGRIILAHAALYVTLSPKSNSAYLAIEKAIDEVRNGPKRDVPPHLRDPHLDGKFFGDGKGYKYPHDYPGHYVKQQYMPNPVRFYEPTEQGNEARIKQFLKELIDKCKKYHEEET